MQNSLICVKKYPKNGSKTHSKSKFFSFLRSLVLTSSSSRERRKDKNIFGCDLSVHLNNTNRELPLVLEHCSQFVENYGLIDGIYRLSGINSNIQRLRLAFNNDMTPDFNEIHSQDIHCVASLLKLFFRELPNPLLTFQLYDSFIDAIRNDDDKNSENVNTSVILTRLRLVVRQLPESHYTTLKYLCSHLCRVSKYVQQTGMNTKNLAIVWAPNILWKKESNFDTLEFKLSSLHLIAKQAVITEYLIKYCDFIFNETANGVDLIEDFKAINSNSFIVEQSDANERREDSSSSEESSHEKISVEIHEKVEQEESDNEIPQQNQQEVTQMLEINTHIIPKSLIIPIEYEEQLISFDFSSPDEPKEDDSLEQEMTRNCNKLKIDCISDDNNVFIVLPLMETESQQISALISDNNNIESMNCFNIASEHLREAKSLFPIIVRNTSCEERSNVVKQMCVNIPNEDKRRQRIEKYKQERRQQLRESLKSLERNAETHAVTSSVTALTTSLATSVTTTTTTTTANATAITATPTPKPRKSLQFKNVSPKVDTGLTSRSESIAQKRKSLDEDKKNATNVETRISCRPLTRVSSRVKPKQIVFFEKSLK